MKKWLLILTCLLLPLAAGAQEDELNVEEYLFGHIADSYEWHICTVNGKEIAIPLPCIIIEEEFTSSRSTIWLSTAMP